MTASGSDRGYDSGLSEVIGFLLILSLIVMAFSVWMIYVVPATGREEEITQMNAVKDRFTDFKFSQDSLWVNNQSGVTLSTSFNLGSAGGNTQAGGLFLPMLRPIASSGTMSVKDGGDRLYVNSSSAAGQTRFNMSILEYQSLNNYWVQQRYYYQTGGVFLAQDNGSVCRISPAFTFAQSTNGSVSIASVNIIPIQLLGGSTISGKGPVRVDSQIRTPAAIAVLQPNTWVNISVSVSDKQTALMWMSLLNETRIRGNITDASWYTFNVAEDPLSKRGSAFMRINGPYPDSPSNPDVFLTLRSADYVVTLNNIASGIS